jgi:uncharacterized protein (DUF1778 family)
MNEALVDRSKMGRPKRSIATTSVKIDEDAYELVRKAAAFLDVSVVDYVSRILRERAMKDLREGAEQFLRDNKTRVKKGEDGQAES